MGEKDKSQGKSVLGVFPGLQGTQCGWGGGSAGVRLSRTGVLICQDSGPL